MQALPYNRAMRLMREIRFSVGPDPTGPVLNSWAGWPTTGGVQPYLVLRAIVEGELDPVTGYICNIKLIDSALRDVAIPLINRHCQAGRATSESLMLALAAELAGRVPAGTRWSQWQLLTTPYLRYSVTPEVRMLDVTQSFEFSASHRLHCPSLSDEENRKVFGKCNNPSGHGHNYQVEVTVGGPLNPATGSLIEVGRLERIVKERVIDRLDHKHLNTDCDEFREMNPSVENIARVIWSLLDGQFEPAQLARVRVWETAKTYAECQRDPIR